MIPEVKGTLLGLVAAAGALGMAFGLAPLLQPKKATEPGRTQTVHEAGAPAFTLQTSQAKRGYDLFERNCAHCHADDARGDEGPNLHDLTLSDARLTKRIKEGVKGEMPAFSKKFADADVEALIAFLRTLKD